MTAFRIPLANGPQFFGITLNNVGYTFVIKWNDAPLGGWVLDILDSQGNNLIMGIPLVAGADLLSPYPHLGFGGQLIYQTHNAFLPDFNSLGTDARLYFVTP